MMTFLINSIRTKARSKRGESITEVLVAIVVSGLAILMLATVIATAVNTNIRSRQVIDEYYAANNQMVQSTSPNGAATITLTKSGTTEPVKLSDGASVSVNLHVDEQSGGTPVVSYTTATATGGGEG